MQADESVIYLDESFNDIAVKNGWVLNELINIPVGKKGKIRDLLPDNLAESIHNLPGDMLQGEIPELFVKVVISAYIKLAEESETGAVDSEELLLGALDFLDNCAEDFFAKNWRDFFDESEWSRIELEVRQNGDNCYEYYDMMLDIKDGLYQGDFFMADNVVIAIQEIEGLMTYCTDNENEQEIFDIVAPVQCGIMDLGKGKGR